MTTTVRWFWYASPQTFFPLAGQVARWSAVGAGLLALAGLYVGFFVAPTDAQQGEAYRIIFIHVPAAWMSMFLYLVMAFWAAIGLAFNTRLSHLMARAIAPTGALFTFIALWTGSLWGKPTWGTYWVWDARLTSELILLFLYFGFMALHAAIEDPRRADRACAVLALVGVAVTVAIYGAVALIVKADEKLKLSAHAQARLNSRQIQLTDAPADNLASAVLYLGGAYVIDNQATGGRRYIMPDPFSIDLLTLSDAVEVLGAREVLPAVRGAR